MHVCSDCQIRIDIAFTFFAIMSFFNYGGLAAPPLRVESEAEVWNRRARARAWEHRMLYQHSMEAEALLAEQQRKEDDKPKLRDYMWASIARKALSAAKKKAAKGDEST